jgi:hypothetical protein
VPKTYRSGGGVEAVLPSVNHGSSLCHVRPGGGVTLIWSVKAISILRVLGVSAGRGAQLLSATGTSSASSRGLPARSYGIHPIAGRVEKGEIAG